MSSVTMQIDEIVIGSYRIVMFRRLATNIPRFHKCVFLLQAVCLLIFLSWTVCIPATRTAQDGRLALSTIASKFAVSFSMLAKDGWGRQHPMDNHVIFIYTYIYIYIYYIYIFISLFIYGLVQQWGIAPESPKWEFHFKNMIFSTMRFGDTLILHQLIGGLSHYL